MQPQCGFPIGDHAIDAVFTLKIMLTKREFNLETHFLFPDCEKVFDQVNGLTLFNLLYKNTPGPYFKQ
jgi:hypothetical protein